MTDPLQESFSRTFRLLALAKLRSNARAISALALLLTAWIVWLFVGRLSVYASSASMKFLSKEFPQEINAQVPGTIVWCAPLSPGQHVHQGDVLGRLDAGQYERQLGEAEANLRGTIAAIDSINDELTAQERARDAIARLVGASARAGHAKVAVSQTSQRFQSQEAAILKQLNEKDLSSKLDELRAERENATVRAQTSATSAEAVQATSQQTASLFDRDVQIAALNKLLTDERSKADVARANIESIKYQIEIRNVRARADGTLADFALCAPGEAITPAQSGGIIVPDSETMAVGWFRPEDIVGRVHPGQAAILRIDSFPWTQYGTVKATVEAVGSEPREGSIRVDLRVSHSNQAIPVIEGLTGVAEIQVERISPWQLLLRTVGHQLTDNKGGEVQLLPNTASPQK